MEQYNPSRLSPSSVALGSLERVGQVDFVVEASEIYDKLLSTNEDVFDKTPKAIALVEILMLRDDIFREISRTLRVLQHPQDARLHPNPNIARLMKETWAKRPPPFHLAPGPFGLMRTQDEMENGVDYTAALGRPRVREQGTPYFVLHDCDGPYWEKNWKRSDGHQQESGLGQQTHGGNAQGQDGAGQLGQGQKSHGEGQSRDGQGKQGLGGQEKKRDGEDKKDHGKKGDGKHGHRRQVSLPFRTRGTNGQ